MADTKAFTDSIIKQLAMTTTWNGTTRGQPLSITFSFVSTLPSYYNIDAINATTSEKDEPATKIKVFSLILTLASLVPLARVIATRLISPSPTKWKVKRTTGSKTPSAAAPVT